MQISGLVGTWFQCKGSLPICRCLC